MARNIFNSVRLKPKKRNVFNLSYTNDFDNDFGCLVPCMIQDVYAGDIYKLSNESFVRTQPLRAPAFMQCDVSYHWFFVPNRLIYDDWTDFIVRGRDGNTDYDKPYCIIDDVTGNPAMPSLAITQLVKPYSLFDYLNFPSFNQPSDSSVQSDIALAKNFKVDMMPFNVYNLIYNEYYRDENLQPEVFLWTKSGRTNNVVDYADYKQEIHDDWSLQTSIWVMPWLLRKRAWRKDYFTSALPFVQKGSPISLMGSVEPSSGNPYVKVQFMPNSWSVGDPTNWFMQLKGDGSATGWNAKLTRYTSTQNLSHDNLLLEDHYHVPTEFFNKDLVAYISLPEMQTNVMSISDLRVALALQQWFELNARTGSDRYFEYLLGHFGVRDRDSRLQRPEYIGGYSHSIQISEVEQTSATDDVTPQGNLAGRGLGYSTNAPIKYRCPEPGWIMCLQSIRPRTPYFQGWPRKYQRWDAFDYYDPLFDHLSEQSIKTSELYFNPAIEPFSDHDVDFGYTPRFAEDRCNLSQVHGSFRTSPTSSSSQNLSYWVSPRLFTSQPFLNSNFIEVDGYNQHLYEMFAYPGTALVPAPHFICHVVNHIKAIRPMSKYATPGL